MGRSQDPTLTYIMAASHSGSTLLAMLLNSHPRICTAGELKIANLGDPDHYRCSCKKMIRECDFWNAVSEDMLSRGERFDVGDARIDLLCIQGAYVRRLLRPLHRDAVLETVRDTLLRLSPTWRREWPVWQRRNRMLIESIAKVSGARIVVDSSKIGLRIKYLRNISRINTKIIRLLRDGRAVALTYMDATTYADARDPALRGGGSGKRALLNLTMEQAAMEWRRSNEEAEHVCKCTSAKQIMRVRYEDLCNNTVETLDASSKPGIR